MKTRLLFVPLLWALAAAQTTRYAIVFDAGSSGTRLYLYSWPHTATGTPVFTQIFAEKVEPGISAYANNPNDVTEGILSLLAKATPLVPSSQHKTTPVYLWATAGMRIIPRSQANLVFVAIETALLNPVRNPFKFTPGDAKILSGEEEGAFMWATVNQVRQTLGGPEANTLGILEMGGASLQLTFGPPEQLIAMDYPISAKGMRYDLYAHSFLNFGGTEVTNQVLQLLADRSDAVAFGTRDIQCPCILRDYNRVATFNNVERNFVGTGDSSGCRALTDFLLHKDYVCHAKPCSILGTYQPSLPSNMHFVGTGNFFYVPSNLALATTLSNGDKVFAGTLNELQAQLNRFCGLSWTETARTTEFTAPERFLWNTCLMGHAQLSLLASGFGFPMDGKNLVMTNNINGLELSWALGGLLLREDMIRTSLGCDLSKDLINRLPENTPHPTEDTHDHLDKSSVVGIALGCSMGSIVIALCGLFFIIQYRQPTSAPVLAQTSQPGVPYAQPKNLDDFGSVAC